MGSGARRREGEEARRCCGRAPADLKPVVFLLVILFALSSWIDINGLWVEMPLLVTSLPEGWSLPSYLVIIVQAANIGPLLYTVARRVAPSAVTEWPVIYLIISLGGAACLALAFTWRHTAVVGGSSHSVALLALGSLLALVDCTSSVVYLPYMSVFRPHYLTALYIGEGFSGLLPGLVGLFQGLGSEPRCLNETSVTYNRSLDRNVTEHHMVAVYTPPAFSVGVFFVFLFFMLCLSLFAFTLLHYLPYCRRERADYLAFSDVTMDGAAESEHRTYSRRASRDYQPDCDTEQDCHATLTSSAISTERTADKRAPGKLPTTRFAAFCFIIAWTNALTNGLMPSVQSFTCLPYGQTTYTLAVRLSTIANPAACFLSLFLTTRSLAVTSQLCAGGTALAGYLLFLAIQSPYPPLQHVFAGPFIVIISFVLMTAAFSYVKVTVASVLHGEGHYALLWCGILTQTGSFIGAIAAFLMVNVFQLFKSLSPC